MIDQLLSTLFGLIPQVVTWFGALFTGAEWRATIVLILATLAGTHIIKIVWRLAPNTVGGGSRFVNLLSLFLGLAIAFPIWRSMAHDDIPWYIAGMIAGPLATVLFKLGYGLLKWKAPILAGTLNCDRRRDEIPIPPVGMPERRQRS